METTELRNMRLKQVATTNGLMVAAMIIFYIVTNVFTMTFTYFFFVLGVIVLIQAVFGLIKGDSVKSFIPIFEKVAIYEKQKMGSEWYKQRKVNNIWNLLFSGLMFLQSYWNRNSPDNIFHTEFMFMFIMTFFLLVMINVSLIIHFRKVDQSTSELDMKGYTWKTNLIAFAIGIVFTLAVFVMTIFYVIS
jgi:hypothetical protein